MTYQPSPPRDPRLEQTAILHPDEFGLPPSRPPLPPRRRPRWGRRILIGISSLLIVALLAVTAGALYVQSRLEDLRRVTPTGLTSGPGRAMTVLLVGSDSRADLTPGQEIRFGSISGQRSDAIMLLRTNPAAGRASVLSIPRDLYLPIAGTGASNRINTAYAGGADRVVNTVTQSLGIPIDHFIEVNFDGFRSIVDSIGGLNVNFPAPARDILAELNVPAAGCILLDGEQGLAYVRSRHYESLVDGRWVTDPTSDFGRIERQQDFIRRMIKKAISQGVRNPVVANSLLNSFVSDVVVDDKLGTMDLLRLGNAFRSLGGGGIEMLTIPTVGARVGGNSVLRLKEPEATETIQRFLNPPPAVEAAPPAPGEVRIQVLNGSGRPGEAGEAAADLGELGFIQTGTGDAPATRTTLIRYAEGAEAKASLVQSMVTGASELRPDAAVRDSDVILVTGTSFAGIGTSAAAPGAPPEATPEPEEECPV